jgi:hypothetical protein
MSLDVYIEVVKPTTVFDANITHNLGTMASEVSEDFYKALWHPEDLGIETTEQLYNYLFDGLIELKRLPEHYKKFNPTNGWGTYEGLVEFIESYLDACKDNPNGKIIVSR